MVCTMPEIINIVNAESYDKFILTGNESDGFTDMETTQSPLEDKIWNAIKEAGGGIGPRIKDSWIKSLKDSKFSDLSRLIGKSLNNKPTREGIRNDPTLRSDFIKNIKDSDKDINPIYIDSVINKLVPKPDECYKNLRNTVNAESYDKFILTGNESDGFTDTETTQSPLEDKIWNAIKEAGEVIGIGPRIKDSWIKSLKDSKFSDLSRLIGKSLNNKPNREGIRNDPTLRSDFIKNIKDSDKDINPIYIDSVIDTLAPKSDEYYKTIKDNKSIKRHSNGKE